MSILISVWPMVMRRCIANWRLLSTILVGVIIATAILSSLPLYTDAIDEFGLKHIVKDEAIELIDINVYAPKYTVDYDEFTATSQMISNSVPLRLREIIRKEEFWITTEEMVTDKPPATPFLTPKAFFSVYSNVYDHIEIMEGYPAQAVTADYLEEYGTTDGFVIEGMISPETAEIFGLVVGDVLTMITYEINDVIEFPVLITALIEPTDPDDEFWMLNPYAFTFPTSVPSGDPIQGSSEQAIAPIFVPEETVFNVIPAMAPSSKASYNWYYYIDTEKIIPDNAQSIRTAYNQFDTNVSIEIQRSGVMTKLNAVIAEFLGKRSYSRIPLFLIVFQITAVIFYYLMMVSNMVIDRQAEEIAIIKSRGGGSGTILLMYLIEGLIISVIGAVIGVYLGSILFSSLVSTGIINLAGKGAAFTVTLSGSVLSLTGAAVLLSVFALLFPALQASRRGIVHQKQASSRPASNPFWKKYYLDIILLIAGGVLYWEAQQSGYFGSINITGQPIDPILLVTPILLIVAFSILFLRVFPLLMKLISKIARRMTNAPSALALWYVERKPSQYMRPILLLVVASGVGIFSASFIGTLEQSIVERNMYESGADLRLEGLHDEHVSTGNLELRYMELEGVENAAASFRVDAQYNTTYSASQVDFLALLPEKTREMYWFRNDLDDKSLDQLMDILAEDTVRKDGIPIPDDAETIGVWVYSEEEAIVTDIYARIRDGKGRYQVVKLGTTDPAIGGWQFMEVRMRRDEASDFLVNPRRLSSLYIKTSFSYRSDTTYMNVYFDDLQVNAESYSEPDVLEDFEDISEWRLSNNLDSESGIDLKDLMGSIATDKDIVKNGSASGKFRWKALATNMLGIYPNVDNTPLTAIASTSFLRNTGLRENAIVDINIRSQEVPVRIAEVTDYFPTLDPAQNGFIVVNLERFFDVKNRGLGIVSTYPNEVTMTLADGKNVNESVMATIGNGYLSATDIYNRDEMIAEMRDDPLMGAAWKGILLISLVGVILVSGLGFLIYSYLSAQSRKLDFAILRTLGFSFSQISGLVFFEQFLVILFGLGFGVLIGSRLCGMMVPFLQLTGQGQRVLPPFVMNIDWTMIGISYGFLFLSFAITVYSIILFFRRVKIYQTLRMGDM